MNAIVSYLNNHANVVIAIFTVGLFWMGVEQVRMRKNERGTGLRLDVGNDASLTVMNGSKIKYLVEVQKCILFTSAGTQKVPDELPMIEIGSKDAIELLITRTGLVFEPVVRSQVLHPDQVLHAHLHHLQRRELVACYVLIQFTVGSNSSYSLYRSIGDGKLPKNSNGDPFFKVKDYDKFVVRLEGVLRVLGSAHNLNKWVRIAGFDDLDIDPIRSEGD